MADRHLVFLPEVTSRREGQGVSVSESKGYICTGYFDLVAEVMQPLKRRTFELRELQRVS